MCVDVAVCMYETCVCVYMLTPAMPCIGLVYSYVVWTLKERLSGQVNMHSNNFHSEVKCVKQFEMHHITSWTFVSDHTRPIALFDFLSV